MRIAQRKRCGDVPRREKDAKANWPIPVDSGFGTRRLEIPEGKAAYLKYINDFELEDVAPWNRSVMDGLQKAIVAWRACVDIDPDTHNGRPVLAGTRFTIAQMMAELSSGKTIDWLAHNYDLNRDHLRHVLNSLAHFFDHIAP